MPSQKPYGCSDYRAEMMLASLRARLRQADLSEEERRALERELEALEEDFYA